MGSAPYQRHIFCIDHRQWCEVLTHHHFLHINAMRGHSGAMVWCHTWNWEIAILLPYLRQVLHILCLWCSDIIVTLTAIQVWSTSRNWMYAHCWLKNRKHWWMLHWEMWEGITNLSRQAQIRDFRLGGVNCRCILPFPSFLTPSLHLTSLPTLFPPLFLSLHSSVRGHPPILLEVWEVPWALAAGPDGPGWQTVSGMAPFSALCLVVLSFDK